MNMMFCGDCNVQKGIFLSAVSICNNCCDNVNFFILTASAEGHSKITQDFCNLLKKEINSKGKAHNVYLIDASKVFSSYLPTANMQTRFTPFCMLRLFADLIPEIPDKILYLDTDVLCRAEIKQLYDTDINSYDICGVPDRYGKWFFCNILKHNYLNSGVLLLNMKRIRQNGLFQKCRDMCRNKKMFMPDQSALNKLAIKCKLPNKYNEQGKIKPNTVFKHFTTYFEFFPYFKPVTIKPWQEDLLHNKLKIFEFDDILKQYQRSINK